MATLGEIDSGGLKGVGVSTEVKTTQKDFDKWLLNIVAG